MPMLLTCWHATLHAIKTLISKQLSNPYDMTLWNWTFYVSKLPKFNDPESWVTWFGPPNYVSSIIAGATSRVALKKSNITYSLRPRNSICSFIWTGLGPNLAGEQRTLNDGNQWSHVSGRKSSISVSCPVGEQSHYSVCPEVSYYCDYYYWGVYWIRLWHHEDIRSPFGDATRKLCDSLLKRF